MNRDLARCDREIARCVSDLLAGSLDMEGILQGLMDWNWERRCILAEMNLAIRGYVGRKILFEDRIEADEAGLENLLPSLATKHAKAMANHELHTIEIEFLDEPDPNERYFRFGTDPAGMVVPLRVVL